VIFHLLFAIFHLSFKRISGSQNIKSTAMKNDKWKMENGK